MSGCGGCGGCGGCSAVALLLFLYFSRAVSKQLQSSFLDDLSTTLAPWPADNCR